MTTSTPLGTYLFQTSLAGVTFDNRREHLLRYAQEHFAVPGKFSLDTLPRLQLRVRCADGAPIWGIDVLWGPVSMGWLPAKPHPDTFGEVPLTLMQRYAKVAEGPHPAPFVIQGFYGVIADCGVSNTRDGKAVPYGKVAIYQGAP